MFASRGGSLDYYISAAGGPAANTDGGRISVRYANGDARTRQRFLFSWSTPTPGPGSEVFVPTKPAGEGTNTLALLGGIAQILSSLVAIVVVFRR